MTYRLSSLDQAVGGLASVWRRRPYVPLDGGTRRAPMFGRRRRVVPLSA